MKQILLMAMLVAGMLLTGCSKDSDNMETKGNTEALIKEQIIGVWRSGDYWVSFDGKEHKPEKGGPVVGQQVGKPPVYYDGYSKAVLEVAGKEVADGGVYIINGNTITSYSEQYLETTVEYTITYISEASMTAVVKYTYAHDDVYTETMSFAKTSDTPASKD